MSRQPHVKRSLVAALLPPAGPAIPVKTVFTYRRDDPWAVTFSFRTGPNGWADWIMCRRLLADGITIGAGAGDVRIEPDANHDNRTQMRVESPAGCALFSFATNEFRELLALTTALVPWGSECDQVDLDAEIHSLFPATGGVG